ncbi:MAG: hypothetical protein GPJ51_07050 [Candidatus Heimdallarchaeota archaeon]|nr:hypothetical protein [Candidatus Heimdallarchaeota archaeon]
MNKDYLSVLDVVKKQFNILSKKIEDLPSEIIKNNLFQYFDQTKNLSLLTRKITTVISEVYEEVIPSKHDLIFQKTDRVFWEYILAQIDDIADRSQKLVGEGNEKQILHGLHSSLERLNDILSQRLKVKDLRGLNDFLARCDSNHLPFRCLSNPAETLKELLVQEVAKVKDAGTYLIDKNKLKLLIQKQLGSLSEDESFERLYLEALHNQSFIELSSNFLLSKEVVDEVKKKVLVSVPNDIEGVSYLKLFKNVDLSEELLSFILDELENENRVVKDDSYETGTIYYFPELYQ